MGECCLCFNPPLEPLLPQEKKNTSLQDIFSILLIHWVKSFTRVLQIYLLPYRYVNLSFVFFLNFHRNECKIRCLNTCMVRISSEAIRRNLLEKNYLAVSLEVLRQSSQVLLEPGSQQGVPFSALRKKPYIAILGWTWRKINTQQSSATLHAYMCMYSCHLQNKHLSFLVFPRYVMENLTFCSCGL